MNMIFRKAIKLYIAVFQDQLAFLVGFNIGLFLGRRRRTR